MAKTTSKASKPGSTMEIKRTSVSQADVPAHSLEDAIRIPKAIADSYGKKPTKPLRVAEAMGISPTSSTFKMLCGASIAYGLTKGGYNAEIIELEPLGKRIVAPTSEGDDDDARREACLRPRVLKDFLTRYNDSKLPADQIGRNVLEELGVPADRTERTYRLITENAKLVGFLRDMKNGVYVDLDGTPITIGEAAAVDTDEEASDTAQHSPEHGSSVTPIRTATPSSSAALTNRVFITHGKNRSLLDNLKELISFGGFEPVISAERETVSKPVPDKVMDDMRSCSAAVIHVDGEHLIVDPDGNQVITLNQNVLIEIGAAMALYGRRFILLVKDGTKLPSNLQGLYEVRYSGDKLDGDATIKLLKAFNDLKAQPLPTSTLTR